MFIRRAPNSVISIGNSVWMFSRIRTDDDYEYDDDGPYIVAYRQFVLHIGRLHIVAEFRL